MGLRSLAASSQAAIRTDPEGSGAQRREPVSNASPSVGWCENQTVTRELAAVQDGPRRHRSGDGTSRHGERVLRRSEPDLVSGASRRAGKRGATPAGVVWASNLWRSLSLTAFEDSRRVTSNKPAGISIATTARLGRLTSSSKRFPLLGQLLGSFTKRRRSRRATIITMCRRNVESSSSDSPGWLPSGCSRLNSPLMRPAF